MTQLRVVSSSSVLFLGTIAAECRSVKIQLWRFPGWSEPRATLLLGTPSSWLHSTWARILYAVMALLLAYFVHRRRIRQIEAALTLLFHQRLSERARLARGLNDTLLQTIEASKLIADDALELSSDPTRMREAMGRLSYWLGRATQEGQTALSSLGAIGCDGNDLTSGFRRAAEECLINRSMTLKISVTGESKEMHPMICDEIYLLGCDAISNACNRPGAERLEVVLTYGADFCIRVRSSGHPLGSVSAEGAKNEYLDVLGIQRRANRFGAKVTLITSSSSNVELTLTVPGRIIFPTTPLVMPPQRLINLWTRFRSPKRNSA